MKRQFLSEMMAKGLAETGIEGSFASVSCSTAGDYPSLGLSQWEGPRADALLLSIPGGADFMGMSYSQLEGEHRLEALSALLDSPAGRAAQMAQLSADCERYVEVLERISSLTEPKCIVYAGMWCPTSDAVVCAFLRNRAHRADLNDLDVLHQLFYTEYARAADVMEYEAGYQHRAERTYQFCDTLKWINGLGIRC